MKYGTIVMEENVLPKEKMIKEWQMEELKLKVAYKIGFLSIFKNDQNVDDSTRLTAHYVESALKDFISKADEFSSDEIMTYVAEKRLNALQKHRGNRGDLKLKGEWLAYDLLIDML